MRRREFLKLLFLSFLGFLHRKVAWAEPLPWISVAEGKNIPLITRMAINMLGGMDRFVKRGDRVVVKPNIAWNRSPEQAANTHPEVVGEIVRMCRETGAKEIIVIDHTCHNPRLTYEKSGIREAVLKNGGKMRYAKKFVKKDIPRGKALKETEVLREVIEADVLINVPVVKVHGGAIVTLSMKNLMGVVKDRGKMHRVGLHQAIADLSTLIRPHLIVLDATRILLTNGPQGPGKVEYPNQVIAGKDPVALDSYGSRLLGKVPEKIPHIRIAQEMGIGKINIPARFFKKQTLTLWEEWLTA